METLKNFLWPIILAGGIGRFIDFLIGRTGQEKAKDFLLKWWVRFDDVRWSNFGREEGFFAGRLIERWFGKKIWSFRRLMSALSTLLLGLVVWILVWPFTSDDSRWCWQCDQVLPIVGDFLSFVIGFCTSVSLTRLMTFRIANLCGLSKLKNFIVFSLMLIMIYALLLFWIPVTTITKTILTEPFRDYSIFHDEFAALRLKSIVFEELFFNFDPFYPKQILYTIKEFVTVGYPIDLFAFYTLPYVPGLFRFFLSIVFVGSFLLRPVVMRPTSLVWARIVESEKPVFTLTFGGAAVFASAISEAAKHL